MVPFAWPIKKGCDCNHWIKTNYRSWYTHPKKLHCQLRSRIWKSFDLRLVWRRPSHRRVWKRHFGINISLIRIFWLREINNQCWTERSYWFIFSLQRLTKDGCCIEWSDQVLFNTRLDWVSWREARNNEERWKDNLTELLKRWKYSKRDDLQWVLLRIFDLDSINMCS